MARARPLSPLDSPDQRFSSLRRKAQAAEALVGAMIVLACQQEFPGMVARGTVLRGWALAA